MSGLIKFFAFFLRETDAKDVGSGLPFGLFGSASHDGTIVATKNLLGNAY